MVVSVLMIFLSIVISVPILIFVTQVFASAFYSQRANRAYQGSARPSLAVLIPAHNEADVIGRMLMGLVDQISAKDRILVVADNCSDDTAKVCRDHSVEVLERFDELNKGKGHALAFGLRHLDLDPREILIVVDADCELAEGCLDSLASSAGVIGRPTQALYLIEGANEANVKHKIAEFALIVKNKVRPLGYMVLRLPCQLMGTGMAFPWSAVSAEDLETSSIVEDLELGLDLAQKHLAPRFCPEALVTSQLPAQDHAIKTQRIRWEHGHLRVMLKTAPKVLLSALRQRNLDLLAMGLDLLVPPLALLVMVDVLVSILATVLYIFDAEVTAFFILLIVNTLFLLAIVLSWRKYAKDILHAKDLFNILGYVCWKLPVYLGFMKKPETTWVKTKRD